VFWLKTNRKGLTHGEDNNTSLSRLTIKRNKHYCPTLPVCRGERQSQDTKRQMKSGLNAEREVHGPHVATCIHLFTYGLFNDATSTTYRGVEVYGIAQSV
jgi:hypothetical protein